MKADLERFRAILLALKGRLTGEVDNLAGEALLRRGDSTAAAGPTDQDDDNYEHESTLSLLQNQEHTLEEIDEALVRIEQGKFGRCEECGGPIPRARLQALPYVRHCVSCARKLQ